MFSYENLENFSPLLKKENWLEVFLASLEKIQHFKLRVINIHRKNQWLTEELKVEKVELIRQSKTAWQSKNKDINSKIKLKLKLFKNMLKNIKKNIMTTEYPNLQILLKQPGGYQFWGRKQKIFWIKYFLETQWSWILRQKNY